MNRANYMQLKPKTRAACLSRIEHAREIARLPHWGAPVEQTQVKGTQDDKLPDSLVGMRWCDDLHAFFRDVKKVTDMGRRFQFNGYGVNNYDMGEACEGLVCQLPARNGMPCYVAGFSDAWNDGQGCVDLRETFTDEMEAARAADRLAELYAELCRDDDAKDRAEQDIEQAHEEIATARAEHSQLCAEMRAAQRMQFDLLAPEYVPPARLSERAPSAICKALRAQLKELRGQVSEAIKTIKERRENYWTAVHW